MSILPSALICAADWPTFGHDPQRSGWAFEESTLAAGNVAGLELKWKTQVKNQSRALSAVTAPVVAGGVVTAKGIKTLVYVAGTANNFFALEAENANVVWDKTFDIHVLPKGADFWSCPNGITATPTIDRTRSMVYVIAVDGRVFGLDLGSGEIKFGPIAFVPPYAKTWSLNLWGGRHLHLYFTGVWWRPVGDLCYGCPRPTPRTNPKLADCGLVCFRES